MVGDLLTAMGYYVAWIAPPGKDGGIDLLAWNDPLGTKPSRIKVQVKRYSDQKINVDTLRSFIALVGDDDVGIMISTSGFTKDAEIEARAQEKRKITLINMGRFFDLWVKFLINCRTRQEAKCR
ncbi:MAG TPA: restriction endonuclease [Bacillota bacterium]